MEFGPVQMLVVGFEHGKFEGEILAELKRLRDEEIIRLVDLLFVNKDDDGVITAVELSDLSPGEAVRFGALAGGGVVRGAGSAQEAKRARRRELWPEPSRWRTARRSARATSGSSPTRSHRAHRPG